MNSKARGNNIGFAKLFTLALIALLAGGLQSAMATSLDLTAGGDGTVNGGYFITVDQQSTGTGVIQSFVRIQAIGSEEGYNADRSSGVNVMPDVNTSPSFTRDITLGMIPIVTDPGGATGDYYEFLLDINQTNANALLSLDQVQIFTRDTSLPDASTLALLTGSSDPRWNLDLGADGDSEVLLDYSLNSGSGSGDLFLYVPVSAFAGVNSGSFVYLYSQFGAKGGSYVSNDGFEEWAIREAGPSNPIPEPTTLVLIGMGLVGIAATRRRVLRSSGK